MRAFMLLALAGLALAGAPRPAMATPSIDACTGIVEPGVDGLVVISGPGTWCLDRDHVAAAAISSATRRYIKIEADDVTLDCRGHRITANDASTYDALAVSASQRSHLVVRRCEFSGFWWAMSLESGPTTGQFLIEDNVFHDNARAINLNGAGSIVRRNRIYDTVDDVALQVSDGGNRVLDNLFDGMAGGPFFIWLRGDVEFRDNTVRGMPAGDPSISPYKRAILADGVPERVMSIRDNVMVGSPYTNGIECGGAVRLADNVSTGFVTAMAGCGDAGDNDISQ